MIDNTKHFPNGISYFTKARVEIPVSFPENKIACGFCRYIRASERLNRYYCTLTDEIIWTPFNGIGFQCPVVFDTDER